LDRSSANSFGTATVELFVPKPNTFFNDDFTRCTTPGTLVPLQNARRLSRASAFPEGGALVREEDVPSGADRASLARELCGRHRGIGADGLIVYLVRSASAPAASDRRFGETACRMDLLNADGSYSEVSGNGVRCLAAWLARERGVQPGGSIDVETDAGVKRLELLANEGRRFTFRAAMGQPEQVQRRSIDVGGTPVDAITLRVGNPQCVVLGEVSVERLHSLAARLAVHPVFPEGSNVELARVEAPGLVRILIWERGVGSTEASGTGACAAAVAAIAYGGAARDVQVVAPGGAQRVEWNDAGLFLTGWAEVLFEARWGV
jgi:diaminopimelate epimerase